MSGGRRLSGIIASPEDGRRLSAISLISEVSASRERMECPGCGYRCVPQWMNDEARCLKCQAVLKTRPSCHDSCDDWIDCTDKVVAPRRASGEVSTYSTCGFDPACVMESKSGFCTLASDGVHNFRFGKCRFCQQAEGQLLKDNRRGSFSKTEGAIGECANGGKCMFKFARCTKCGRGEGVVRSTPGSSTASSPMAKATSCSSSPKSQVVGSTRRSSGLSSPRNGGYPSGLIAPASPVNGTYSPCSSTPASPSNSRQLQDSFGRRHSDPFGLSASMTSKQFQDAFGKEGFQDAFGRRHSDPFGFSASITCEDDESSNAGRVRLECFACGFKCVPQWMNLEARCLKCQVVLRTRKNCYGDGDNWTTPRFMVSADRPLEPGEISKYKFAPSSAMESKSGACSIAPDGMHNWRFGKCTYCQKGEGELPKSKGVGANPNPGGAGQCREGGKCMFKFSKCKKCGRSEYS